MCKKSEFKFKFKTKYWHKRTTKRITEGSSDKTPGSKSIFPTGKSVTQSGPGFIKKTQQSPNGSSSEVIKSNGSPINANQVINSGGNGSPVNANQVINSGGDGSPINANQVINSGSDGSPVNASQVINSDGSSPINANQNIFNGNNNCGSGKGQMTIIKLLKQILNVLKGKGGSPSQDPSSTKKPVSDTSKATPTGTSDTPQDSIVSTSLPGNTPKDTSSGNLPAWNKANSWVEQDPKTGEKIMVN